MILKCISRSNACYSENAFRIDPYIGLGKLNIFVKIKMTCCMYHNTQVIFIFKVFNYENLSALICLIFYEITHPLFVFFIFIHQYSLVM